jgi:hypothetical protein
VNDVELKVNWREIAAAMNDRMDKAQYKWKNDPPSEFDKARKDRETVDKFVSNMSTFNKYFELDKYITHDVESLWPKRNPYITPNTKEENTMNNNISMEALSDSVCIIDGYMYNPTSVSHRSYKNTVSFEVTLDPKHRVGTIKAPAVNIKNVIFNPPATIVFWSDNTKTVVKCHSGDEFDPEKGLTMAYFKKMHGNKYSYFNEIKHWTKKYKAPEIKPIDWSAIATAISKTGVDLQSIQGFGQMLGEAESPSKSVPEAVEIE